MYDLIKEHMLDVETWAKNNIPEENLLYRGGFFEQLNFVRYRVGPLLSRTVSGSVVDNYCISVASSHYSKSVLLPVFKVCIGNNTTIYMRYNFHNWIVSCDCACKIDFGDLFDTNSKIHSVYCEGFHPEWIFESYAVNPRKFTAEISTGFNGYCNIDIFFWILHTHLENLLLD